MLSKTRAQKRALVAANDDKNDRDDIERERERERRVQRKFLSENFNYRCLGFKF